LFAISFYFYGANVDVLEMLELRRFKSDLLLYYK